MMPEDASNDSHGYEPDAPPVGHRIVATTGVQVSRLMIVADPERRPDERAYTLAHLTLVQLSDLGFEIPASDVYADPDRAIRLLWNRGGRSVEMVFPSTAGEPSYLYRSDAREYAVEESPSPESLLAWLQWAVNEANSKHPHAA